MPSAHGGDQTSDIWISRSISFPERSCECWGLRLLLWNCVWNFGDSRENVCDLYGDLGENSINFFGNSNYFKSGGDLLRLWHVNIRIFFDFFFDLLTPYTHFPVMMCRVREYCSLMYSAAWYHVHILTPYTPSPASMCRVSVSQKNIRILPCSRIHSTWIFSRPAHRVWFWQSQRLSRRCCDTTIRERRWGKRQSQTLRQSRVRYGLRV